ncbi:ribonuclease H-like domain-containing protein [Tanacetum coccineum]|uniref:Ribonuclease H-like domain-containing protein n=1 Tax=Tanacetum coccineum TaxID=301880 RepID=A0ABQ5H9Y2_9ASTR
MEAVSSPMVAAAKLPVLNPNEYELWKMRIKQYFLMTDYALWEVIVNGDSPPPKKTINGVEQTYPPTTAEEKLARKNELKARGTLLMALPNEHQLNFNTYKSAKSLIEAIDKRSLSSEWKTHTLIWRNKPDLETLSMDDLYNNLKIYEAEVKGSYSTSQNTQNVAFVSSNITGSTNEAINTAHSVFAANSKANTSTLPNVDSLSDAEIDLKWQMAMLTMRARRFLKKTGRNLGVNGIDTIGFNKTKVECYNCHRRGHFARECRASKYQDKRNKKTTKRTVPVEETTSNDLVSECDGLGYDWSDQDAEGPTNFALMAYTSSGSSSSSSSDSEVSTCSKACLKSYETLKEHYDNLTKDFNKSQINVGAYKAGLESVEARLDVYKKNEAIFEEDIKILKLDIMLRDNALIELRNKFEKAEKERDDLRLTLEKFESSSKNLSKLLEIQVSDKFKTGVGFDSQVFDSQVNDKYKTSEGYHAVPPLYTGTSCPLNMICKSKPKSVSEPLIEDWISDSGDENETEFKSKQRKPSFAKLEFVKTNEHVKSPRKSVKKVGNNEQAKYPRKTVKVLEGNPQQELKDKRVIDSGCSRHMIGNRSYLTNYEEINGGFVAFGGSTKGGKITGKGKIRTRKLDIEDVYFVKELNFNLFSVSQMCDKKNSVLFTNNECVVLSPDFKLTDESHILLKVPRKDNMYNIDLKNAIP